MHSQRRLISILFLSVIAMMAGCASNSAKYPVSGELFGQYINTTVDSEVAFYYLEKYLSGEREESELDRKVDLLHRNKQFQWQQRKALQQLARETSTDFATLLLAHRLLSDEGNRAIQQRFEHYLEAVKTSSIQKRVDEAYVIFFMPGWDYAESGLLTGADFAKPRQLVAAMGIENRLLEINPHGSVSENAETLTRALAEARLQGKKIIITSASSSGSAVALALSREHALLDHVAGWINVGGILRGSPFIDYYHHWSRRWFLRLAMWWMGWKYENVMSMSEEISRPRFAEHRFPSHLKIINYVGIPLSGSISEFSTDKYPLLKELGPNDGLTLITDAIAPNSVSVISLGNDHYVAEDPQIDNKAVAMVLTMFDYIERR